METVGLLRWVSDAVSAAQDGAGAHPSSEAACGSGTQSPDRRLPGAPLPVRLSHQQAPLTDPISKDKAESGLITSATYRGTPDLLHNNSPPTLKQSHSFSEFCGSNYGSPVESQSLLLWLAHFTERRNVLGVHPWGSPVLSFTAGFPSYRVREYSTVCTHWA